MHIASKMSKLEMDMREMKAQGETFEHWLHDAGIFLEGTGKCNIETLRTCAFYVSKYLPTPFCWRRCTTGDPRPRGRGTFSSDVTGIKATSPPPSTLMMIMGGASDISVCKLHFGGPGGVWGAKERMIFVVWHCFFFFFWGGGVVFCGMMCFFFCLLFIVIWFAFFLCFFCGMICVFFVVWFVFCLCFLWYDLWSCQSYTKRNGRTTYFCMTCEAHTLAISDIFLFFWYD